MIARNHVEAIPQSRNYFNESPFSKVYGLTVEPLENNNLPEDLLEGSRAYLAFVEEQFGFLPLHDKRVAELQEIANKLRNPSKPPTRVLISLDPSLNAGILPDGTMVISAGMLNILLKENKLGWKNYIIMHEQSHFDKNHAKKNYNFWFENKSENFLASQIGMIGLRRFHETEADFLTLFYADKLGVSTMEYGIFLRFLEDNIIGEHEDIGISPVHGDAYQRDLNAYLTQDIFHFSTSDKPVEHPTPNKKEYIDTPTPYLEKLFNCQTVEALEPLFFAASPEMRKVFVLNIYNRLDRFEHALREKNKGTKIYTNAIEVITKTWQSLTLFISLMRRLWQKENKRFNPEQRRYATQLIYDRILDSESATYFSTMEKIHIRLSEYGVTLPKTPETTDLGTYKKSDFTLDAISEYIRLDKEGGLYTLFGEGAFKDPSNMPDLLWATNLPRLAIEQSTITSTSVINWIEKIRSIQELLEQNYPQSRNWFWGDLCFEDLIESYCLGLFEKKTKPEKVINSVVHVFVKGGELLDLSFSKYDFEKAANTLCHGKKDSESKWSKGIAQIIRDKVELPSELFSAHFLKNEYKKLLEITQSDTTKFVENFAVLVRSGNVDENKMRSWVVFCLQHFDELPDDYTPRTSEEIEKSHIKLYGEEEYQNKIDLLEKTKESKIVSRLIFLVDLFDIYTSKNSFVDKFAFFKSWFNQSVIKEAIEGFSFFALDQIYRKVSASVIYDGSHLQEMASFWHSMDHDFDQIDREKPEHNGDEYLDFSLSETYFKKFKTEVWQGGIEQKAKAISYLAEIIQYYSYTEPDYSYGVRYVRTEKLMKRFLPFYQELFSLFSEAFLKEKDYEKQGELVSLLKEYGRLTNIDMELVVEYQQKLLLDPNCPLEVALDLLDRSIEENTLPLWLIRNFVQLRVRDKNSYEVVREKIIETIEHFVTEKATLIGVAAFLDSVVDKIGEKDRYIDLLEAVLDKESDEKLRRMVLPIYWELYINDDPIKQRGYNVDLDEQDNVVIRGGHASRFVPFDTIMDQIYSSNDFIKSVFLKKILLSRKGLLVKKEHIDKMVSLITTNLDNDPKLTPLITDVLKSALEVGDPVKMFLAFSGAILPLILDKPAKRGSSLELAKVFTPKSSTPRTPTKTSQFNNKQIAQVLDLKTERSNDLEYSSVAMEYEKSYKDMVAVIKQLIGEDQKEKPVSFTKRPVQAIKKAASQTAPLGEAIVQLGSQFTPMTGEYEALLDSFDSTEGQTNFSIFYMLEKLAETDLDVAEFYHHRLIKIGKEIGGGKVKKVVEVWFIDRDGQEKKGALLVNNPNAGGFLSQFAMEAEKISEDLVNTSRKKDNKYQSAGKIINIASQWTSEEIYDTSYSEYNSHFLPLVSSLPQETSYQVKTQGQYFLQHPLVKLDELVEGETIGRHIRKTEQSDAQEVVLTLTNLMLQTVMKPVEDGSYYLGIKDYSYGNAMITDKKELYLIDRQYQTFSEKDVQFIRFVLKGNFNLESVQVILNYFFSLPENQEVLMSPQKLEKLQKLMISGELEKIKKLFIGEKTPGSWELINLAVQYLDEAGIVIPHRLRLFILKTIWPLSKLFKDVGMPFSFETYCNKYL